MAENRLLPKSELSPDNSNLLGLTKVEFKGEAFYRVTPSQSQFVAFRAGFYQYEIEQHGRWCSKLGRMTVNLDVGEWQIVIPIAGDQFGNSPNITSSNASLDLHWVEGDEAWAAAVIDVNMQEPVLQLDFHGRSCFTPARSGNSEDTRELSFWMLDEFLFRPLSSPLAPVEGSADVPDALLSDIANAEVISAANAPIAVQDRISSIGSEDGNSNSQMSIWVIRDAVVIGRPPILGFYSSRKLFLLQETAPYDSRLPIITNSCKKSLRRSTTSVAAFDQVAALCGEWSDNICHWFLEYVPKAIALEATGYRGVYLVPCNSLVFPDSLNLLGIEASRIKEFVYDYVEAGELFVTERFTAHQLGQFPYLILKINDVLRGRVSFLGGSKRLYIGRRGTRRVSNETDVLLALREYEFQLVYLEDYTIGEQIGLAAGAECIAGPHGAGMTAALFMRPGTTMIEFFSPIYINPCMTAVCDALRIRYFMITSRMNMGSAYPHGTDIEVDIPILKLTLRTALG
jgi:hypothetical protein